MAPLVDEKHYFSLETMKIEDIKKLANEKKALMSEIVNLREEGSSLTCEVEHLAKELELKADKWRTEADGRKLLVTEVNELTSRLKEMETLARAEQPDEQEDPIKLRTALTEAKKTIAALQTRLLHYDTEYEAQVPRTKYEEARKTLNEQVEETNRLKEELDSTQSRYDLLQEHCVSLNTYRDLYYIQVTYCQRILGAKGDPSQKIEYITTLLHKWRRLASDKQWADVQRIVGEELTRLESGQGPVMVRGAKSTAAARHKPAGSPASEQPLAGE